jgi:hypothetical protein
MISEFPHKAPKNYSYEYEQFNTRTIQITLRCHLKFDYNHGASTSTIWGFFNSKKKIYYAPINSKTIGKEVNIKNTTPYSAMQIEITPLEKAFL